MARVKDTGFVKFLVLVNGGVPLALLGWDAWHHQLGANPVNFAIRTTGMLTLVFLTLTLLVTPVRTLTGWNWLIFPRRTLGLYAFFYGCCHFLIFFGLDRALSVSSTLAEMVKRKYLIVGSTGLLLMVPLAVTSTDAMVRRLGAARWQALHRLVYLSAIAGVIHYYLQVKADTRQPIAFGVVLVGLLGYRLTVSTRRPKPAPAAAMPAAPAAEKPRLWSGQLRVARITPETPDVRTFRLAPIDGGRLPFEHRAGQHLVLTLSVDGRKVVRTYTIASSPTERAWCEITVKHEENGVASGHLHTTVREGDLLSVSAPAGRFTFDGPPAAGLVLIAGGVGITPLMSILRSLTARGWPGDIHFLFCVKTEADIIFRRELETLQQRCPNLHLVVTLTRVDGTGWSGRQGRIGAEMLREAVPGLASRPVYVCGPSAMMAQTIQVLRDLGVPAEQIKSEAFAAAKRTEAALEATGVAAKPPPAETSAEPALVTFARTGKSTALVPGKTLLEIAEDAGLHPDFSCRSGICGTCKTRLLAGSVTMEVEDALDAADRANNIILLCQAHAADPVTIDI